MYGVIAFVVMAFQLVCGVLAVSSLRQGQYHAIEIKHALCLAVKGLAASLDYGQDVSRQIAEGIFADCGRRIPVDMERLLCEFNGILAGNLDLSGASFYYASAMSVKVLVAGDRFYVADCSGRWSMPFFFCMNCGDRIVHFCAEGGHAVVHAENGEIETVELSSLGIDSLAVQKLINGRISEIVGSYLKAGTYADVQMAEGMPDAGLASFHVFYPVAGLGGIYNGICREAIPLLYGYGPAFSGGDVKYDAVSCYLDMYDDIYD